MSRHLCRTLLVVLALTFGVGRLFGQTEAPDRSTQPSGCAFDVSQFARTPHTSPELVRLESELIDPQVPVSQTLILQLNTQAGRDAFSTAPKSPPPQTAATIGKEGPRSQDDFSGKYLDILARVLPSKKAEAVVDSLITITEDQFLRIRPAQPADRQCLQEAVAKTLPTVPLEVQSRILFAGEYPLFKSSALTLYLHQLYESIDDQIVPDEDDSTF
jgi:hypothetical protein